MNKAVCYFGRATTFQAVARGPKWANTVFIVNFDEWGGFLEHVVPPRASAAGSASRQIRGRTRQKRAAKNLGPIRVAAKDSNVGLSAPLSITKFQQTATLSWRVCHAMSVGARLSRPWDQNA
jgi:hypothetical protein